MGADTPANVGVVTSRSTPRCVARGVRVADLANVHVHDANELLELLFRVAILVNHLQRARRGRR